MRWTIVDVGTCLAAAAAGVDADAVNIASGAAEVDILVSTGAGKQKHLLYRTRRHRRRRCNSPLAENTNHAEMVHAEPETEPAVADPDSSGPDTHSWWDRAMWRALQTRTSQ